MISMGKGQQFSLGIFEILISWFTFVHLLLFPQSISRFVSETLKIQGSLFIILKATVTIEATLEPNIKLTP
jgi:hypothetical protein